jgi:hypothetical protein
VRVDAKGRLGAESECEIRPFFELEDFPGDPAEKRDRKHGDAIQNGEITMQYLLMCCFDETAWNNLPGAEKDKIMRDYGEWVQNLVNTGHFRGGAKLHPAPSATTVRMKNGRTVFTDGPFAETKEQLGGYHVIDCMDLNEAMSIAARIPTLPAGGSVEVRCIEALEC